MEDDETCTKIMIGGEVILTLDDRWVINECFFNNYYSTDDINRLVLILEKRKEEE